MYYIDRIFLKIINFVVLWYYEMFNCPYNQFVFLINFLVYINDMIDQSIPVIYDYFDVIKYLRDYYDARHKIDHWFSYRYIQNKTGIDPGYLFKIFQGKKPVPQNKISAIVKLIGLTQLEQEYFTLLVLYGKAQSNDDIRRYFEKILQFQEIPLRILDAHEYEYYTKWYYTALRQIISIYPFNGDFTALSKMTVPVITITEAKKGIALLCKLGLVEKGDDGVYRAADKFLSTGKEWQSIAVRCFQQETINLALSALDTVPKDQRDISTVTITLSKNKFADACELIRRFRQEMLKLITTDDNPDAVYHVNIQMIPIARITGGTNA
jgi:uncharacterized protein (TIGR02147 family)